jgi:molybdopterin biosynthesis enzyme MoaB
MTTAQHKRPSFGLIIIGDEIMSGKRADKHLPKVIELMTERGLQLDYAEYVGDSPERITATLKRFQPVALAQHRMTIRGNVLPKLWVLTWPCTHKPKP